MKGGDSVQKFSIHDCSTAQGKAHAATCEAGARDAGPWHDRKAGRGCWR